MRAIQTFTTRRLPLSVEQAILSRYFSSTCGVQQKARPVAATALSNRQKFKQIQPPLKIYEKLEKLGFGSLPSVNRYRGMLQKKARMEQQQSRFTEVRKPDPEPTYSFPFLSFFAGAKVPSSIPAESLNEVAFVGRSNVGKSSLINSLAETATVRTSDKPGLTQQLNFFNASGKFHMVDMPGYGFAYADETLRTEWRNLMTTYITNRKTLKRVFVILDARHGVKVVDAEFLQTLEKAKVKFQIVLTKADLVILPDLARRIVAVGDQINNYRNAIKDVLVVSSQTGAGVNELRKQILFLMGQLKPKRFYESREEAKAEKPPGKEEKQKRTGIKK